jgi:hypothetical protein
MEEMISRNSKKWRALQTSNWLAKITKSLVKMHKIILSPKSAQWG